MLRAPNQVSGVFCLSDAASDLAEINAGKRISFMRRRKRVAHGTEVGRGSTQNPRPCHLRPCAMLLAPLPHGLQAVCSALRHPVSKGWGIYGNFLPYLPEALPLYGPLRHPTSKGWGVLGNFSPYLCQPLGWDAAQCCRCPTG